MKSAVYQSAAGFSAHLEQELHRLGPWEKIAGDLYRGLLPEEEELRPVWVQNIWTAPEELKFTSIREASSLLRERNGLWYAHPSAHGGRSSLIREHLPPFRNKPKDFPVVLPQTRLGAWTLLDEHTLLASASTSSPFPGGEAVFREDRENPPSSAYLKLWEAFTLMKYWYGPEASPGPGDRCLDAGACPGGWTWVLAGLGSQVMAVDRSPLEKGLDRHPLVEARTGDGFKMTPDRVRREGWSPFTWILSDMAAFPAKVWDWVGLWRESDPGLKFVITLKMQGEADWGTMEKFRSLAGSKLIHLYHNKHEVTWIKV